MTAEETAAKIISKVGLWWPLAEEDQLRTAANGYEACAGTIRAAAITGQDGAKLVTGGNTGKAFSAFDDHWDQYHAGLPATAKSCEQVAKALRDFADAVDDAKKKIINLAIEIGATIAVGVACAIFTFGTSAGAAAARTAMLVARGVTIAMGLTGVASTIVATMLVGAVFGAVEGFIAGIVAQVGKQVLNDGPGITASETMAWTGFGAAGGALAAGGGLAIRGGVRALKNSDNILLTRLRNINWADETGSISFWRNGGTADPRDLKRTEALRGKASSRQVNEYTEMMKNGTWRWGDEPIEVFQVGDELYVINGHHRLAAARRAGVEVVFRKLTLKELTTNYGYTDADHVVRHWAAVPGDRLR